MSALSRVAPIAARLVLGTIFFVFGLNFFLQFIQAPPPPPQAYAFIAALGAAGYVFPIIKVVEIAAGVMLLSNRFVPLALALLAPIIVNIVMFHTVLAPSYGMAGLILVAEIFLAWTYRAAFAPMLARRVAPTAPAPARRVIEAVPAE